MASMTSSNGPASIPPRHATHKMMGICSVLRQYAVNRDIKEPPNDRVEPRRRQRQLKAQCSPASAPTIC
jgi:hypothetical protein